MKYVDEYRDSLVARKLVAFLLAVDRLQEGFRRYVKMQQPAA